MRFCDGRGDFCDGAGAAVVAWLVTNAAFSGHDDEKMCGLWRWESRRMRRRESGFGANSTLPTDQ